MDREQDSLRDGCDSIMASVEMHEGIEHGGEPCVSIRLNAVAFMAHRLGLGSADPDAVWLCVRKLMEVYEAE